MLKYKKNISSYALITSNVFIFFGVLIFDYNLFSLILIYWIENVIIGFFNVFKIFMAKKEISAGKSVLLNGKKISGKLINAPLALFFLVHYGMFTFVHGIFVFVLFKEELDVPSVMLGIAVMFASHLISFWINFVLGKEYEKISPTEAMAAPYGRIIILHLTILFGAFLITMLGEALLVLLLFATLKTIIDWKSHKREHNKLIKINEEVNTIKT